MLKLDREGERFAFENDWDILIPAEIEKTPEKGLVLTVIPLLRESGKRFLSLYADRPFSREALTWFRDEIAPKCAERGYLVTRHSTRHCGIFRFPAGASPREPLPGGRVLTAADEERNRTTFDLSESVSDGRLCFGQIESERVVSVAVTHAAPNERETGGTLEIGIETIPEARGRGYAASSLSGVTAMILSRGLVPEYRCTRSNVASKKTALAAGYVQVGEACSFVLRRTGR